MRAQTREDGELIAAMKLERSLTIIPIGAHYTVAGPMGPAVFPGTLEETLAYCRSVLAGEKPGPDFTT